MANINNLNTPSVPKLERRVSQVESGAPMNNAGVGRSGFEVYDNGTINVSSGNIIGAGVFSWQGSFSQAGNTTFSGSTTLAGPTGVTGSLTVQGSTDVTGPFTVTGPTQLNGVTDVGGALTVTGPTSIAGTLDVTGVTKLGGDTSVTGKLDVTGITKLGGDTSITGALDVTGETSITGKLDVTGNTLLGGPTVITGVTTLKNDLDVLEGGKINVGQMQIEPANGGQINWTGGSLSSGALGTLLVGDRLEIAGTSSLKLSGASLTVPGLANTSSSANVYYNPATGRLYYKP